MEALKYLSHYPEEIQLKTRTLISNNQLGEYLRKKYSSPHSYATDKALYEYVSTLRSLHLRSTPPVSKILYDSKIRDLAQALGTHTYISRVQGGKLKAKNEIRISHLFKNVPEPFLNMIAVHELAHLKEKDHNKAFYKLCTHMQPHYHQLEFDVRLYLTYKELFNESLWI